MYDIDGLITLLENKPEEKNKPRTIEQSYDDNFKRKFENIEDIDNDNSIKSLKLLNKQDIMEIFSCEDQKALKLLHILHSMCFAVQLGREYYVREERLIEFLTEMEGRKVVL